ncbi:MAG: MBL fold metallo-hydrolase [Bacteroidota bacterium]
MERLRQRPEGIQATWIGHATVYVQTPDIDVLFDPVFSHIAGPLSFAGPDRRSALPIDIATLPRVDFVLISHDHYDHLDKASITRLSAQFDPVFIVPLGLGPYVREWGGRRVAELDWWQYVDVPAPEAGRAMYRFTCTPAVHDSGRRVGAFNRTLWSGWYVERLAPNQKDLPLKIFYAGDTAYGPHFGEIHERMGSADLAILPIGAYAPRSMTAASHMTPEEAIQAFIDLGGASQDAAGRAPDLLPVHWGTFELTDEPLDEPPMRLTAAAESAGVQDQVHILGIGQQHQRVLTQR